MTQSEMFILGAGFILGSFVTIWLEAYIQKTKLPIYLRFWFVVGFALSVLCGIATK